MNNTDRTIEVIIGNEGAEEPDYWFKIPPRRTMPSVTQKFIPKNVKDLKEEGIDLSFYDLIVINNGEKYHEDNKS